MYDNVLMAFSALDKVVPDGWIKTLGNPCYKILKILVKSLNIVSISILLTPYTEHYIFQ
jgi:hypothetical protein